MTAQDIITRELIGLDARIVESSDPTLRGVAGRIVYETKRMLVIAAGKARNVPKNAVTLSLKLDGNEYLVEGSDLLGRPEDRVQRLR